MSPVGYQIRVAALAVAALAGCAGNGAGLDSNGNPLTPGGSVTEPLTADFQSIQDNVFTPICTKCHIGAGAPEGLQLDADHSYALLVGVPSTEQSTVMRVAPGDPDSSYLVRKLQGSAGITGVQMPFGGPYLPQSTIDIIRQWVTAGAAKTAAAATVPVSATAPVTAAAKAAQRFGVIATSPDNDSIVAMVLPGIVVAFNGDIDPNLTNNTTVTLEKSDAATAAAPALTAVNPIASRISISTIIPAGNPSAILITPRTPLAPGTYRVTLHETLADMNARALGDDYSFTFTVDASQ